MPIDSSSLRRLFDKLRPLDTSSSSSDSSYRPPLKCTSCGIKVSCLAEFGLAWEDGAGMCTDCLRQFRERSGFYQASQIRKRAAINLKYKDCAKRNKPVIAKKKRCRIGSRPQKL